MEQIIGTFIRLAITALVFACFVFCGIKIGVALRKKENAKEEKTNKQ